MSRCAAARSAPVMNENVENESILIDSTPKPMLFPANGDDDFVEMPFVATCWSAPTNAI